MIKILITGSTGQVGFELLRSLAPLGEVIAPTRAELDLADLAKVASVLRHTAPDVIVNAAAWTAVDAAESHSGQAYVLNAELPEQLAQYARQHDSRLIHYSSDYVYAGDGDTPRSEQATSQPLSVYGRSKLAGDQAIIDSRCRHLIFRTSWVYSAHGHNFLNTMLRLAQERSELRVVNDQIGAPTPARLIAQVTALALTQKIASRPSSAQRSLFTPHPSRFTTHPSLGGIYHLAARGETSWHGFACEILRQAAARGLPLKASPERVMAIPTSGYPTPAERPLNSRLDISRLEKDLGLQMPEWQEPLAMTLGEKSRGVKREEKGVMGEE